jgi:hypothetical protein
LRKALLRWRATAPNFVRNSQQAEVSHVGAEVEHTHPGPQILLEDTAHVRLIAFGLQDNFADERVVWRNIHLGVLQFNQLQLFGRAFEQMPVLKFLRTQIRSHDAG